MTIRDDPKGWSDEYFPAPSNFDRRSYQKELDLVCGIAAGTSIIRVVWGAEEEIEAPMAFSSMGHAVESTRIGRHRTRVKGIPGKVRKRRWIMEEFQAPAQVPDNAYVRLPGRGGLYLSPQLVAEKRSGKYLELYIVADHSKCLIEDCSSDEYFCFGDYRQPDQTDIEKLRKITAKRLTQAHADPFKPISQNAVNLWNKEADEELTRIERDREDKSSEFYRDAEKTLSRTTTN